MSEIRNFPVRENLARVQPHGRHWAVSIANP
jgi:hypothetical protein